MRSLLYIHGFLSSPLSHKAQLFKRWCDQTHPDITFLCPALTAYPDESILQLEHLIQHQLPEPVGLIGSSLGGFYASVLAHRYNLRAVLVNPAVAPHDLISAYIDKPLKNYHSAATYQLDQHHMDQLKALDEQTQINTKNIWLMVQTGDETLDYQKAVEKYKGCKQLVEEGGDHSFQHFDNHFSDIIHFLNQ